jgi:hypothetical protein
MSTRMITDCASVPTQLGGISGGLDVWRWLVLPLSAVESWDGLQCDFANVYRRMYRNQMLLTQPAHDSLQSPTT